MRFKDFAKRLLNKLAVLKELEPTLHDQVVIREDQLVIQELEQLLSAYSQDNGVIDDEALLQPFYDYLMQRYQRIALSNLSYHANPNTRANQACTLLANQLIIAANEIHYKTRPVNELLMPKVVWQMNDLAEIYLDQIDQAMARPSWRHDLFIDLESYYALLKLKAVLQHLRTDVSVISPEAIRPILAIFSARWKAIEDTDGDYINNKTSAANHIYHDLAKTIFTILQAGRYNIRGLSADRLLRPVIHAQKTNADDAIKKTVFSILKREASSSGNVQKPVTDILQALSITEADFSRLVLNEIKEISHDDFAHVSLEVCMESQQALSQLKELCQQYAESAKPVNRVMLSTFIDFLHDRWKRIGGTPAAYAVSSNTAANQACHLLADVISVTAYHMDYLNREQSKLLMRTNIEALPVADAKQTLQQTIVARTQNRDQLLASLTHLDTGYWDAYLNLFEVPKLIQFITQGHTQFGALLEWKESCHYAEEEYKALLYTSLSVYQRLRAGQAAAHTTYLGALSSYVMTVPSRDDKLSAVKDVMHLLTTDLSLSEIVAIINDEKSGCYQQHCVALNDGTLKIMMAQLATAAEACRRHHECDHDVNDVVRLKM